MRTWNLKFEIWTLKYELWSSKYEIEMWSLKSESWNLKPYIWSLNSESWNLNFEVWSLKVEFWTLKFEVLKSVGWNLKFKSWTPKFEAGTWNVKFWNYAAGCNYVFAFETQAFLLRNTFLGARVYTSDPQSAGGTTPEQVPLNVLYLYCYVDMGICIGKVMLYYVDKVFVLCRQGYVVCVLLCIGLLAYIYIYKTNT